MAGGEDRTTGWSTAAGKEPVENSALMMLLWMGIILGLLILGWKMALRAAEKKDADEQMEDWEPADLREKIIFPAG